MVIFHSYVSLPEGIHTQWLQPHFLLVQHGSTWFNLRGSAKGASKVWSISGGGACTHKIWTGTGNSSHFGKSEIGKSGKTMKTMETPHKYGDFPAVTNSICRDCFPPLHNWNTRAHQLQLRATPWLVALLFTLQTLLHCFSLLSALLLLHNCPHSYYCFFF